MGNFAAEFLVTLPARNAYLTGITVFGVTPIEQLVPDHADFLAREVSASFRGALDLLGDTTNPVAIQVDTKGLLNAQQDVLSKLKNMFSPGSKFEHSDAVGPLMDSLKKAQQVFGSMKKSFDAAGAAYIRTKPLSGKEAAQQKVKNWTGQLASRLQQFNVVGRDATFASAVVLEHEAVAFREPVEAMWGRLHLADTAQRLYAKAGDLPDELKLRVGDNDLPDYVDIAANGLTSIVLGTDLKDVLSQFKDCITAIADADAPNKDLNGFIIACEKLDELLYRVDQAVTEKIESKAPADGLLATSMVLCEGLRGALDMKGRTSQESREAEKKRVGNVRFSLATAEAQRDRQAKDAEAVVRKDRDAERKSNNDQDSRGV